MPKEEKIIWVEPVKEPVPYPYTGGRLKFIKKPTPFPEHVLYSGDYWPQRMISELRIVPAPAIAPAPAPDTKPAKKPTDKGANKGADK